MRLTDVISHMNLAVWPSIAMVLFLAAFVGVAIRIYSRGGSDLEKHRHIPMDEE